MDSQVDWSCLPIDLIHIIVLDRLVLPELIKFGLVCSWWRSSSSRTRKRHLESLLLGSEQGVRLAVISVFSCLEGKCYKMRIPEADYARICGLSQGILAMQCKRNVEFVNLCSERTDFPSSIELPTLNNWVVKVCTFSDVYVILASGMLFFSKKTDSTWTPFPTETLQFFLDVTCIKGNFYALSRENIIEFETLNGTSIMERRIFPHSRPRSFALAECSGELLLISWLPWIYRDERIKWGNVVEKIDTSGSMIKVVQVKDLGDHALFVSSYQSNSISTLMFPCCRRNFIYSADDPLGVAIPPLEDI